MSHSLSKKFTFGSLLLFALPTTVMMVVMSLYTIVDGVFVSRFVSTNALSSVNIVYPVINIVLGISVMLSTGSNAIVAKKMGEGRPDSARETFTTIILHEYHNRAGLCRPWEPGGRTPFPYAGSQRPAS